MSAAGGVAPGQSSFPRAWSGAALDDEGHELTMQDMRVMARMRHTGVSYADIGYIFRISAAEARGRVLAFARAAAQSMLSSS